jgi:transposase
MTDEEFVAVAGFIPNADGGGRGRPAGHLRRTLDAIFWVAASKHPWRALPPELGKPDTAHRTLRRWAKHGVLDRLLMAVTAHPLAGGTPTLRGMAWWLCRAWRRMARVLPLASLALIKRLNLVSAWPAAHIVLPDANLSERAKALSQPAVFRASLDAPPRFNRLLVHAGRLARACQRLMRSAAVGNRADWTLK